MSSSSQYKPQILVVLPRFPYPLEKGDKLRAFYQIKELSQTFRITLFAISDVKVSRDQIKHLEPFCEAIEIHKTNTFTRVYNMVRALVSDLPIQTGYFYSTKAKNKVKVIVKSNDFKHIYCQLIRTSEIVKNIHHIPKTLDYMDALSAGIERRIELQSFHLKWLFKLEAKRLKKYERDIFDFFEHHSIISEQDRNLITHPSKSNIKCIPNGIDISFFEELKRKEEFDFVFVGNMSYPPNVEAVHYIASEILPEIPEATLLISGASPHPSVIKLSEQNNSIHLTGWVDDIRTSYSNGKIFLAPMMIGTGMQNKLLEAMALRTPCITTQLANNAIKGVHEEHIMVGNTKEELISLCKLLLQNEAQRSAVALNGHNFVKSNYTWDQSVKELVELFNVQL
jgi:sugar transferase (PEP-CTERM/EpsH1 system associated)